LFSKVGFFTVPTSLQRGQNGPPEWFRMPKETALLDKENMPESAAIDGEE